MRGRMGAGVIKNGVRGYLEKLARDANWVDAVLGKMAAKCRLCTARYVDLTVQQRSVMGNHHSSFVM